MSLIRRVIFLRNRKKRNILLSFIFFILIGLTHFGVFSVSLIILMLGLLVIYHKKAILPILGVAIFGVLMVYLFDRNRAESLLGLWNNIFEKPFILQGPLSPSDLFNFIFSYILIGFGIFYLVKSENKLSSLQKKTLTVFLSTIFILSFPLFDIEYARRFILLLFIPHIIVLFVLSHLFHRSVLKLIGAILVFITVVSVFLMTGNIKPPSITKEAFQDLKNLAPYISEPDETLIIARHGLEWWTAWQLHTKVGQDKSISNETFLKYKQIICLVQLDGINQLHPPGQKSPFHEPFFPI